MQTIINNRFLLTSFAFAGFLLLSGKSFAQQESEDQTTSKKTITIHVTKEVDGNTFTIDTTVVTDGDFDADAFLEERGVFGDKPGSDMHIDRKMIIRRPAEQDFTWSKSESESPDTLIIDNDTIIMLSDGFDSPITLPRHGRMMYGNDISMPMEFSHKEDPQVRDMLEDLARSVDLDNVMPFGEMKQVVVKKKRNGKKVIITFENRDEAGFESRKGHKKDERVIIYRNGDESMTPQHEERVIIQGDPGKKMIIHRKVEKTENGDQVIINAEVDKPTPGKREKKVIIIKEEKIK